MCVLHKFQTIYLDYLNVSYFIQPDTGNTTSNVTTNETPSLNNMTADSVNQTTSPINNNTTPSNLTDQSADIVARQEINKNETEYVVELCQTLLSMWVRD